MKLIQKPFAAVSALLIIASAIALKVPDNKTTSPDPVSVPQQKPLNNSIPKIQAAILLDVSGSMDGLIDQAKAQLWNMVSVMGKASCDGVTPQIEIALYEYGRDSNDPKAGYVKQLSGFTTDLDGLSQKLFSLTTNGGSEYCGQVISTSLNELSWDTSAASYKVIFIAGNEDFLQGKIHYTQSCDKANSKGVIVNTIYCGDRMQGIREHWNLSGECGKGSYTNINQNARQEDIATPYDSAMFTLNTRLNGTYIAYGNGGAGYFAAQESVDKMNYSQSKSAALKRVGVKGKKSLYKNESWDLVDASDKDSTFYAKVDLKTLPAELQNKSRPEIQKIVKEKNMERVSLQKEIADLSMKRESYIATAKKTTTATAADATLETEVEKIIKEQAKRFRMTIQ
ncbi:hypothetical protein [Ferruginibacter sp. HRS2-29]|uniref:hypothetical protein n=1 Tax=Ferruginibacter sp. HRS2-29 TaxID=2487334 RepID=UPI0020CFAE25|nr:hypothetical protein [Ferruginibacter sp. HRS2-29]MCP9749532.1 VWA domain-containing protein [Ferruginibacter sp. HRS2-29]